MDKFPEIFISFGLIKFLFHLFLHEIKVNPSYLALMQLSGTSCHLLKRKKRQETNGDENPLLSGNYLFWEEGQQSGENKNWFCILLVQLCLESIEYITLISIFLPYFILFQLHLLVLMRLLGL